MTIKYFYKCDSCGHDYAEQRLETESQFFILCNSCGIGNYIEISQEIIAE